MVYFTCTIGYIGSLVVLSLSHRVILRHLNTAVEFIDVYITAIEWVLPTHWMSEWHTYGTYSLSFNATCFTWATTLINSFNFDSYYEKFIFCYVVWISWIMAVCWFIGDSNHILLDTILYINLNTCKWCMHMSQCKSHIYLYKLHFPTQNSPRQHCIRQMALHNTITSPKPLCHRQVPLEHANASPSLTMQL